MARGNPHPKPGPGIPKGYKYPSTVLREKARERLAQKLSSKWDALIDTATRLALGEYHKSHGVDSGGKPVLIYRADPDTAMLKSLIEFMQGKAAQPLEHSGEIGNESMDKIAVSLDELAKRK